MDHEPHLMSEFDQAGGAVPAQVQVETKGGELGGFPTVRASRPTLLRRLRALPWVQIGPAGRVETRTISMVSLQP